MDSTESRQSRIEDVQERMGEAITMLREAVAKVATKDDIMALSQQVDKRFGEQLTQAHNQMPAKLSVGLTAFMALIAFASLLLAHIK